MASPANPGGMGGNPTKPTQMNGQPQRQQDFDNRRMGGGQQGKGPGLPMQKGGHDFNNPNRGQDFNYPTGPLFPQAGGPQYNPVGANNGPFGQQPVLPVNQPQQPIKQLDDTALNQYRNTVSPLLQYANQIGVKQGQQPNPQQSQMLQQYLAKNPQIGQTYTNTLQQTTGMPSQIGGLGKGLGQSLPQGYPPMDYNPPNFNPNDRMNPPALGMPPQYDANLGQQTSGGMAKGSM
jgi:hypothetical protein